MLRKLTIVTLGALAVSCAEAPAEHEEIDLGSSEQALDLPIGEQNKKVLELGGDIAAAYTGAKTAYDTVKTLGTLLGIFPDEEANLENMILNDLASIKRQLDALLTAVTGAEWSELLRDTETLTGEGLAASGTARNWVRINNKPLPEASAQTVLWASLNAANTLSTSQGFFERQFSERGNDGEDTVTAGVVTRAEWKEVISNRPAVTAGGHTFEWRMGLPALVQAVAARLNVLAAVYPNHVAQRLFQAELLGYRARLLELSRAIEDNIGCGFSLWTVKNGPDGKPAARAATLKAMCADPFTGTFAEVAHTATPQVFSSLPDCPPMPPAGTRSYWPTPGSVCTVHWGRAPAKINTASSSNHTVGTYFNGSAWRPLKDRFWSGAPSDPAFSGFIQNGLDDARAQLRIKLGLFEVRRMADRLYALAHNSPRPDSDGRIRSAMANRCLGTASAYTPWSGAEMVPAGEVGASVVNAACVPSDNLGVLFQAWRFNPIDGSIRNYWNRCLDVQWGSTRRSTPLWLWDCYGGDAQRWSYDPESHLLRNGLGRVLDVQWANTAAGTPTWTWDENGGAAQRWGYLPPLSAVGPAVHPPICATCVQF